MKITLKGWLLFIFAAILCFCLWYKFGYPQFAFVDLSVGKNEAQERAVAYLNSRGIDTKKFSQAVVFNTDDWADRYLQKTLGIKSEEEFIQKHDYELFSWAIRFFKEFEKEEYLIEISPKTGEVISYRHLIEDIEPRATISKEAAREKAEEFLKETYRLNLNEYDFHEEKLKQYEQRVDYTFSWEKKGVYIPWKKDQGKAKLLIGATVSGKEIRAFYKNSLDIPENFQRYIENQLILGEYLATFSFIFFMVLIMWSIYCVIKRRNTLIIRFCKNWYIFLSIFLIIISIAYIFNNLQNLFMAYPTSTRLVTVIVLYFIKLIMTIIFTSIALIMPGLTGESLCYEVMRDNKNASFLHYIRSTFYSRSISRLITLGYLLFFIFLGLQAVLFYFGHKYLGVWKEWMKLTQFSSAYLPILSVFIIGTKASLGEEIVFRLFGISWGKRYLKNTFLAVVLAALIWGFGHTEYAVFPVWFRGIEISIMGLLFGFIFINYGIIPLIVAHYLFDVFWGVAAYILGHSPLALVFGSIFILLIPFIFAAITYFINKEEKEREMKLLLDPTQKYNLDILINFISLKKSQGIRAPLIKKELLHHNWDPILVDLAIGEVFKDAQNKFY